MPERAETPPPPTREQVIEVVIHLAEREGDAALNMRSVAAALGVSPKLLYTHVSGKDELFELAASAILKNLHLPDPSLPWSERLAVILRAGRALLHRYAGIAEWPLTRGLQSQASPAIRRLTRAIVSCLIEAGLLEAQAQRFFSLYEAFTLGELIISKARMAERGTMRARRQPEASDDGFEAGLQFAIAGIRAVASAQGISTPPSSHQAAGARR
jgi:AcrR family transcriptional regulator